MAESSPTQAVEKSLIARSTVTFDSDGQVQEAEGYCSDCCEHMCSACLKYHIRFSATKHHKIIEKEARPGQKSISSASDICTERCHNHKDEIIRYFCPTHKILGCSVCITLKHKLCNDVTYIPEAVADLSGSQELKDFQSKLDDLINESEHITKATQSNIKLSAEYRAEALQEIETYRQELNDALDKLKEEVEHQSEEIEAKETEMMNSMANKNNQLLAELQRISLDIKELLDKKQHCKLFIYMKTTEDKLTAIPERIPKREDMFVTAARFQPNLELHKFIQKKDALGTILAKNPSAMNAIFLTNINVKSPENIKTCIVSAAVLLSESKLVITNWDNVTTKLIDIERNNIMSEFKTEKPPVDVARLDNTHVVVTLPGAKKLIILKSENDLSLDEEICCDAKCWYVARVEDKLVVSFSEQWEVRIMNMAGEMLQTFVSSSQGDKLFSAAPRLSVSSFNQAIYASDMKTSRITMFDMDGNVMAVYEDADLKSPRHTAVDDTGMVYLCDANSHNIHLLTPDSRKVKILLSERDGIHGPLGICYCKVTQRLYVSMYTHDIIKVFKLS